MIRFCKKCGAETEHYNWKYGPCKICKRKQSLEYGNKRYANDLEFREWKRQYNRTWANKEYATNPKFREDAKRRSLVHKNEKYANNPKWRAQRIRKSLQWQRENPEKHIAKRNRYRARKLGNGGSYTAQEFLGLVKLYGNRCLCCGVEFTEEIIPTVDHVLPVSMGGRNDIQNIQPLCGPCNSSKNAKEIDYRWDCT